MSKPITTVEDAVRELGALPMPVGAEPQMPSETRAAIAELIGDAKPATARLVEQLAKSVRDRRDHEHPTWEDLYCLNLVSWMGERMGPVLRRLLDAEERIERRRTRLAKAEADLLEMRGLLSPNGGPRRIPAEVEIHEHVAPAVEWLLNRVAELEAAPVTVYRAEHPDSGIVLGHYSTEAGARAHCEATERRSWAASSSPTHFAWTEDEDDGVAEMTAFVGGEECTTGYIVTALEVPPEYDPDADE
ncbi:hypothetical protein ABZ869_01425 [Streptomyces sp. NPDC046928]|uniref:hypothetical protein n=1 Tax=Streptomyces sp. NPDC046928 TaxID=3155021 RepID=UPI0033FE3FA9